jgi:hypothetical protein
MSLLSRLFGSGNRDSDTPPAREGESYSGFTIYPEPIRDGARWRIAARIEKEIEGESRTHRMIRADTLDSADAAATASAAKARMLIDEQGDRIFD